jgi:hypothetical protein
VLSQASQPLPDVDRREARLGSRVALRSALAAPGIDDAASSSLAARLIC